MTNMHIFNVACPLSFASFADFQVILLITLGCCNHVIKASVMLLQTLSKKKIEQSPAECGCGWMCTSISDHVFLVVTTGDYSKHYFSLQTGCFFSIWLKIFIKKNNIQWCFPVLYLRYMSKGQRSKVQQLSRAFEIEPLPLLLTAVLTHDHFVI